MLKRLRSYNTGYTSSVKIKIFHYSSIYKIDFKLIIVCKIILENNLARTVYENLTVMESCKLHTEATS